MNSNDLFIEMIGNKNKVIRHQKCDDTFVAYHEVNHLGGITFKTLDEAKKLLEDDPFATGKGWSEWKQW